MNYLCIDDSQQSIFRAAGEGKCAIMTVARHGAAVSFIYIPVSIPDISFTFNTSGSGSFTSACCLQDRVAFFLPQNQINRAGWITLVNFTRSSHSTHWSRILIYTGIPQNTPASTRGRKSDLMLPPLTLQDSQVSVGDVLCILVTLSNGFLQFRVCRRSWLILVY